MTRIALVICGGIAIGLALTLAVARIGPPAREDIHRAQKFLAYEGYSAFAPEGRWNEAQLAALNAYEADWGLPETTEIGWTQSLNPTLMAMLDRSHPRTRPQWIFSTPGSCRVWNTLPLPRQSVFWDAICDDGFAAGKGQLVWRHFYLGSWVQTEFSGTMLRGKPNGQGVFVSAAGDRYEGRFVDDAFHGKGVYVDAGGAVFQGLFFKGYPNGFGRLIDGQGQIFEGNWKNGCLDTWAVKANFLRTKKECGIEPRTKLRDLFNY